MMRFVFKKRFKQSLKRSFGLFVVFAMVLQSVGLPGFTAIALASDVKESDVEISEEKKDVPQEQKQEEEQEDSQNVQKQEGEETQDTEETKEDISSQSTQADETDKTDETDETDKADEGEADETQEGSTDEDDASDENKETDEDSSDEESSSDEKSDDGEEERSSDYNVVSEGEELNFEEGKGVILDTAVSTEREVSDEDSQEEESEEERDDAEKDASEWIEDAKERGYDIIEVEEDETYEYGGKGFSIRFTDIDEDVDEAYRIIAVKEVTLTQEQQEALGAMSDIAYDVISPMENESFSYELTLPTPEGSDENSVEIVYAEDEESLDDSKNVTSVEKETVSVEDGGKKTKVKDLDHFTIFVVTSPTVTGGDCTGVSIVGSSDECYNTIQEAIDTASSGDTIDISTGTFTEKLNLRSKKLTINGSGVDQTIIDASGFTGHAISSFGDDTTITDVSLIGTPDHYGFKVSGVSNITLENIKVDASGKTGVDLNGVNGASLNNIEVSNTVAGFGIIIGDSNDISVTDVTTSNNAWGGVTVQTRGEYYSVGSDKVTFSGEFNASDAVPFFVEEDPYPDPGDYTPVTNLTAPDKFTHIVYSFRENTTNEEDYKQFTYWESLSDAKDYVNAILPSTSPFVFEDIIIYDVAEENYYVIEGLSIQDAIDATSSGDTIHVSAGTHTEEGQVLINKDLIIQGEDRDTTIVKTSSDTTNGSYLESDAWFLVKSGASLDISGLTFDGNGHVVKHILQSRGAKLIVDDSIFKNAIAGTYDGRAISIFTGTENIVSNSFFENIGRIGVHIRGGIVDSNPIATVQSSTYIGKGSVDGLDYAVEFGGGGQGVVDNLTVSENLAVASTDSSASAGVLATDYYGTGTKAEVKNSRFENNSYGILVGYDSGDETDLTVSNNKFINNANNLKNVGIVEVSAENNWWGSAEFEDIAPKISGEVDYDPWCVNEDCTESTEEEYSEAETQELSTTEGDDVKVGDITIKDPKTESGDGSIRVAKYESEPESGGIGLGVEGFYYSIETSGDVTFPIDIEIAYSDDTEADNYLDEDKFISLYYYDEDDSEWKDYRNDDPASTVSINKDANVISASLLHLTPIVPVVDVESPTVTDVKLNNEDVTSTHIRDNNCNAIQNFYPVKDVIDFSAVIEDNLTDVVSADFTIRKVNSGGCTQTGIYKSGKVNMTEGADDRWSGSFDTTSISNDGEYTIQLITKDGAGNQTMKYVDILVDNTNPTISNPAISENVVKNSDSPVLSADVDGTNSNVSRAQYRIHKSDGSKVDGFGWVDMDATDGNFDSEKEGVEKIVNTTGLSDGDYIARIRAFDASGNKKSGVDVPFTVDSTPPEVTLTSPVEGYVSGTVSIEGTVTDVNPHHYHLIIKNSSGATVAGPGTVGDTNNFSGTFFDWDTTSVTDGQYEIRLSARDAADNKDNSVSRVIRMVTVDNTAPITSDDVSGVWNNGGVTVNLTCTDDGSGCDETYYTADGSEPTTSSSSGTSFVISDEGEHTIKYFSVDVLGNTESVKTAESQVRIDLTDPESTIDGAENNEVIYASAWDGTVSGTASDNLSGVEKVMLTIQRESDSNYWNGASWQGAEVQVEATGTTTWSYALGALPEDSYTITSRATDNAGNVENTYSITIVYDKTIPEVVLTIDPSSPDGDNGWYVSTPEITLSASDNFDLERIEYKFDGDTDWSVYTEPVSVPDGERTFSYRAIDKADNVSDTGTKFVKVDTEEPNEVDDITVEYSDGVIELRWDTDDSDIYDVYLYRGQEKTFTKDRHSLTAKIDGDEDEYDDDNVEPGDKLYYKLMSRDEAGNTSDSKIVSVEIPEEEGGEIIVVDEGIDTAPAGDVAGDATENETLTEEGLTQEEPSEEGSEEGNDGQGNTSNEEGARDEDDNGEVLGEEADAQTQGLSTFTWLVILAGGGLLGAWLFRMAKKKGFIG